MSSNESSANPDSGNGVLFPVGRNKSDESDPTISLCLITKDEELFIDVDLSTPGEGIVFTVGEGLVAGLREEEIPAPKEKKKVVEKELTYETEEQRELRYKMGALRIEIESEEVPYEFMRRRV